jgi:hypothetical protein
MMDNMFSGDFVVSLFHPVSLCCFEKKDRSVCPFVRLYFCMHENPPKIHNIQYNKKNICLNNFSIILHTLYCVALHKFLTIQLCIM